MIDLLTALLGGNHCGWCTRKPTTRWERLTGLDGYQSEARWYTWGAHWLSQVGDRLGIWRLGQRWHERHHRG